MKANLCLRDIKEERGVGTLCKAGNGASSLVGADDIIANSSRSRDTGASYLNLIEDSFHNLKAKKRASKTSKN